MNDDITLEMSVEKTTEMAKRFEQAFTIGFDARNYATQLVEYAQITGHHKISVRDIAEQFDCGKLTAKATYVLFKDWWEHRNKKLDRAV